MRKPLPNTPQHLHTGELRTDLWPRVDRLMASCVTRVSPEVLVAHGAGLLAASHLHTAGHPLPPLLQQEREGATMVHLAGRSLLQRIRDTLDGPIILIKGPEVAAHYPTPALRTYGDLDILVPDSAKAKVILLAAGFEEVNDYEFSHTQRPLRWPRFPLLIELHHDLPWLRWTPAPPLRDYFATSIPSRTGVAGVSTLPQTDHVLLVASHAWRHAPLRRISDLIDVAVLAEGQDRDELDKRARDLKIERVWRTTLSACDALFGGDQPRAAALPRWARHLYPPRERSVAEVHVARWVGALWAPTVTGKSRNILATLREDFGPLPGEAWSEKLARTSRAIRDAHAPALLRSREFTRAPSNDEP